MLWSFSHVWKNWNQNFIWEHFCCGWDGRTASLKNQSLGFLNNRKERNRSVPLQLHLWKEVQPTFLPEECNYPVTCLYIDKITDDWTLEWTSRYCNHCLPHHWHNAHNQLYLQDEKPHQSSRCFFSMLIDVKPADISVLKPKPTFQIGWSINSMDY